MFKRFQVLDLFFGNTSIDVTEWIDAKKELPKSDGIFKVKCSNGDEIIAYFLYDKAAHLMKYFTDNMTHWFEKDSKSPVYNVTQWGKNEMD